MITGHSKLHDRFFGILTWNLARLCEILPHFAFSPFFAGASRMASDSLTTGLSLVIAPVQRTPRPGHRTAVYPPCDGKPKVFFRLLLLRLWRGSLIGSTSSNWRSSEVTYVWWADVFFAFEDVWMGACARGVDASSSVHGWTRLRWFSLFFTGSSTPAEVYLEISVASTAIWSLHHFIANTCTVLVPLFFWGVRDLRVRTLAAFYSFDE